MIGCGLVLAAQDSSAPAHKKTQHTVKKAATKSHSTAAKTTAKHSKTAGKHSKTKSAAAWRSRQLAPTSDRYKEIQSALANKGYLNQPANGVWDSQSTEALRHFQQDQSLEPTGKLNSLSLIALGLGAKHGSAPPIAPASIGPQGPAPVLTPQNAAPPSPARVAPAPSAEPVPGPPGADQ